MSDDAFHLVVAVGVFLACAASIAQAIVLAALFRAGKEAVKAGKEAQGKFAPRLERVDTILVESGRILQENRTQVGEIVKDTLEIAKTARQQTERFSQLLDHANGRAKARLAQIDATVDHDYGAAGERRLPTSQVRAAAQGAGGERFGWRYCC